MYGKGREGKGEQLSPFLGSACVARRPPLCVFEKEGAFVGGGWCPANEELVVYSLTRAAFVFGVPLWCCLSCFCRVVAVWVGGINRTFSSPRAGQNKKAGGWVVRARGPRAGAPPLFVSFYILLWLLRLSVYCFLGGSAVVSISLFRLLFSRHCFFLYSCWTRTTAKQLSAGAVVVVIFRRSVRYIQHIHTHTPSTGFVYLFCHFLVSFSLQSTFLVFCRSLWSVRCLREGKACVVVVFRGVITCVHLAYRGFVGLSFFCLVGRWGGASIVLPSLCCWGPIGKGSQERQSLSPFVAAPACVVRRVRRFGLQARVDQLARWSY